MLIQTYFPEKAVTNGDLEKEFPEWTAEKIEQKVGIVSRHVAGPDETPLDLAEQACRKLFSDHPGLRKDTDFLLVCTQNPDFILPGNASLLQKRLGLPTTTGSLDYNLGCSGFIYGLALARGLLSAGIAKNVLLVTSEAYTKRISRHDKANRSIFGDAAAATVLTIEDSRRIGEFVLGTDGAGAENLRIRNGGLRCPAVSEEETYGCRSCQDNYIFMDGPEIFNFTIEAVPSLVNMALEKNQLRQDEIDLFIFHQANSYILNFLRKLIRIPEDRFYLNMRETGNTVSSTIPIALADVFQSGRIQAGDKILLAGFGVGYSYGATILHI
jgi:possible beta-ketoacyl-acyl-carrier-protein synthase I